MNDSMQVMSVEEIATRLNLCAITVYKLMKSGQLRSRQVNGRWFCTEGAVREFLKPQVPQAPPAVMK